MESKAKVDDVITSVAQVYYIPTEVITRLGDYGSRRKNIAHTCAPQNHSTSKICKYLKSSSQFF